MSWNFKFALESSKLGERLFLRSLYAITARRSPHQRALRELQTPVTEGLCEGIAAADASISVIVGHAGCHDVLFFAWEERLRPRSRGEARALRGLRSRYLDDVRPRGREERRRFEPSQAIFGFHPTAYFYFPFGRIG